jgi:hypothetical protein
MRDMTNRTGLHVLAGAVGLAALAGCAGNTSHPQSAATHASKAPAAVIQPPAHVSPNFSRPRNQKPDIIARAYYRTVALGTAHVTVTHIISGRPVFHGTGDIDLRAETSDLVETFAAGGTADYRDIRGVVYRQNRPTGKPASPWLAFPLTQGAAGLDPFNLDSLPVEAVEYLGKLRVPTDQSTIHVVGQSSCEAEHARAQRDGTAGLGSNTTVDVCLTPNDRISLIKYSSEGGQSNVTSVIRLSNLGERVKVQVPTGDVVNYGA